MVGTPSAEHQADEGGEQQHHQHVARPRRARRSRSSCRPRPVSVMAPTMMPALAVATPMPIMLRAPQHEALPQVARRRGAAPATIVARCAPEQRQHQPAAATISAISGRASPRTPTAPGDSSSTIRHQISTPIGMRKCRPARTVGQGRGSWMSGASDRRAAGRGSATSTPSARRRRTSREQRQRPAGARRRQAPAPPVIR